MIISMLFKRMIRKGFLKYNEDDFDVDAALAKCHDDASYDPASDLGVGETLYGKKAFAEWMRRWKEEFPKRKFDLKNICFSAWPLSLKNVITLQWTLTETDKHGKTFKYDGVSVMHMKNFKLIHGAEHISFVGLPKLSDLIEPFAED